MTDRRYPCCTELGVLRRVNAPKRGTVTLVSTGALYAALGWQKYQKFLPHMRNDHSAGLDPKHVEAWLRKHE